MFNFTDLEERQSGGFLKTAATVLAVGISGLASFQFFAQFSGALLAGLLPAEFLSVGAGLICLAMLEGGTLFWQRSVQEDADSQQQLLIARAGYTVSLIASVTITCLFFLLSSSLVAPYLADVAHIVNAFAAFVLVAIISFQFTAIVSYNSAATKASAAQQEAKLRALHNSAEFSVKDASTRADLEHALAELQKALPEASRQRGTEGAQNFIAKRYGRSQDKQRTPAGETFLSQNGRD